MRFLVDMNLSPDWIDFLAAAGIEAVHWSALGDERASDAEIMAYARSRQMVVFTHDLDFSALLASSHHGGRSVLQLRARDVLPAACGDDVVRVIRQHAPAFKAGAIVKIDKSGARVRTLPLRPSAS
jgi:predicted nuclease of predicted toxin-antitoxin system